MARTAICPRCLGRRDGALAACPDDGARLVPLDDAAGDPRIGAIAAGRYVVTGVLGEGGMATIYRAHQLATGRDVALKVLSHAKAAAGPERFMLEARTAAELRSSGAVKVHELGRLATGELFIAMELVVGRSLEQVLREEGPLAWPRAAHVVDHIAETLEEPHGRGLVHRDLKPSNVMIEGGDAVKLLDFGIVKASAPEGPQLTQSGEILGTPGYMAPELWSRDFGDVGPATDVYALGVLLFEMLTRRLPFPATSVAGLMHAHVYEAPTPLAALRPDLPRVLEIDRLIARCLEKVPADRFASMAELRRAVRRVSPKA